MDGPVDRQSRLESRARDKTAGNGTKGFEHLGRAKERLQFAN